MSCIQKKNEDAYNGTWFNDQYSVFRECQLLFSLDRQEFTGLKKKDAIYQIIELMCGREKPKLEVLSSNGGKFNREEYSRENIVSTAMLLDQVAQN